MRFIIQSTEYIIIDMDFYQSKYINLYVFPANVPLLLCISRKPDKNLVRHLPLLPSKNQQIIFLFLEIPRKMHLHIRLSIHHPNSVNYIKHDLN